MIEALYLPLHDFPARKWYFADCTSHPFAGSILQPGVILCLLWRIQEFMVRADQFIYLKCMVAGWILKEVFVSLIKRLCYNNQDAINQLTR